MFLAGEAGIKTQCFLQERQEKRTRVFCRNKRTMFSAGEAGIKKSIVFYRKGRKENKSFLQERQEKENKNFSAEITGKCFQQERHCLKESVFCMRGSD
jgi:hypothetical protein